MKNMIIIIKRRTNLFNKYCTAKKDKYNNYKEAKKHKREGKRRRNIRQYIVNKKKKKENCTI